MSREKGVAAVERVVVGLSEALAAEFQSPVSSVVARCEWAGEDFNRISLAGPTGGLDVVVTSTVGEEGADVRVVVFDFGDHGAGDFTRGAFGRELGRVARAVAAIPEVDSVWPDAVWPKTFFASVRPEEPEEVDS